MNYNKSVWVDVFSEKDFRRYRKGRIVAKLINIGFGNVVNSDKIIAVVSPEAAPVKRMVQRAKESNRIIDATQGRRTKAVLITVADKRALDIQKMSNVPKNITVLYRAKQPNPVLRPLYMPNKYNILRPICSIYSSRSKHSEKTGI